MNKRQVAVLWATCVLVVLACAYSIYERDDFADGMQRSPPYLIAPIVVGVILFLLLGQRAEKAPVIKPPEQKSDATLQREAAEPERVRLVTQLLANKVYDAHPPQRPAPAPGLVTQYRKGGEESLDATLDRAFFMLRNQARLESFLVAYSLLFARPGSTTGRPPGDPLFYKFRVLAAETVKPLSRAVEASIQEVAAAMGTNLPQTPEEARVEELLSKADERRIAFNEHKSLRRLASPYASLFGASKAEVENIQDAVAAVLLAHMNEGTKDLDRLDELVKQAAAAKKKK